MLVFDLVDGLVDIYTKRSRAIIEIQNILYFGS